MIRLASGMLFGAAWGFVFRYFGRCDEGVCMFTSNRMTAVTIGATLGAMWAAGKDKFGR